MAEKAIKKGGSFLVEEVLASDVFTPEDFSEEHRMIIDTTDRFVKNEILPHIEKLEHKDWDLSRKLMLKAGELGLLGTDIEEKYGGSQMGSITTLIISEHTAAAESFGVTLQCHTGIGTMPLVLFGTKSQKEKYLPSLVSGEKIGAYALTEPEAGTDALSIKTTAVLSPDGKYYKLDGTKQFITNGALAGIIFTYAKIGGDNKMTAFILERGFEGVSTGAEEKKLGIRGSSTCSIFLDGAKVPVENVLFETSRGHVVAFNILDLGRFKIAAVCVGACKLAIENSVKYAKQRKQFGKPICEFGMIKHKLAEMATKTYMLESMVYRTGGLIEETLATLDPSAEDFGKQSAKIISDYAVECSINKVYGSEVQGYVADEAVQIYGGYGYIEEYPVERMYRDSRITRLFEGTNEINRVIITGGVLKKALKNELPLFTEAENVTAELPTMKPLHPAAEDGPLGYQRKLVERAKKILIYLAGAAAQKYGMTIEEQQEIQGLLADIAQEIYAMESGLLRALKSIGSVGEDQSKTKIKMVRLYVNDAMMRISNYACHVISAMEEGEVLDSQLSMLRKALQFTTVNTVQARRDIAARIIEAEKFVC